MVKLVNQTDFVRKMRDKRLSLFSRRDVQALFGVSPSATTMLLHRYSKRGFILRVKRGIYALEGALPPELYIANQLYNPSYISREFALSYHRVIPENVYEITCITTRATQKFERFGKVYSYRHIMPKAFTGYVIEKQRDFTFRMADPEKAFVDTLYYRVLFGKKPLSRFNKERINPKKALRYAKLFGNRKLVAILRSTLSIHD
ncbi:MAG: type IV toxin-antitoxin system AbiEi family antitoxin domain-containing protein [Patescibacteria group bacterium]